MAFNHSPQIVKDNLVLYLDAGSPKSYGGSGTTWTDISRNGNNGTLVNGVSAVGGAMVFDGVNDYVSVPYTSLLAPTSQITFGGWFYLSDWNVATIMKFLSKTESGGYQIAINGTTLTTGFVGALVYINGSYRVVKTSTSNITPYWHQIFITFTGDILNMYVDGKLVDSLNTGSFPIFYLNNNILAIAAEPDNNTGVTGDYLNGRISVVQIYSRALSQAEILQNFNAQKGRYGL